MTRVSVLMKHSLSKEETGRSMAGSWRTHPRIRQALGAALFSFIVVSRREASNAAARYDRHNPDEPSEYRKILMP
jgi:hypothetical protein